MGLPGRSLRALGGPLVALAALAVALPASASAGVTGYPYVSSTFDVVEDTQVAEDVQCPGAGDMAISGGTYSGAPINEMLWLKSSRPGSTGDPAEKDSWTVEVQNVFDGVMTTYPGAEVWAVCDDGGAGEYKVRTARDVKVREGRQVKAFRKCKDGEAVVGGGADVSGDIAEAVFLSTSAPRDDGDRDKRPDGWYVVAEATADSAATMDVYAVCDRKRGPKKYRYRTDEADIADGEQGFATAICDFRVETRVGGGVRSHASYGQALRINTSAPSEGTAWEAAVDNLASADDDVRKITATAICLK